MEIENTLTDLGFKPKEVKIYLTCLQLGSETAFNIAKKSNLKRPTVYVILDNLLKKGLVTITKTRKATLYSPVNPKRLIKFFKEKESQLEDSLPELESLYNARPQKPKIQIFEGAEGITAVYTEIVESFKKGEVLCYGSIDHFISNYQNVMDLWQKEAKNKKHKIRELFNISDSDYAKKYIKEIKQLKNPNHLQRIMPEGKKFINNDNIIYSNKLAIFSTDKDLFVIVIESADIVNSYRAFFDLAWEQAKKIK
jgi:sugar-specific transcriptional regulator TrmB